MDDRDQSADRLAGAFAEFRGASLRRAAEPDPDEPRRRAYRRLRNRVAAPVVAATVALLAVAVGLAGNAVTQPPLVTTDESPPATEIPPATPSTAPTGPTPSSSATPTTPTSPTPTATASGTPSAASATPSGGRSAAPPSATSTRRLDLSISSPGSVTLDPTGDAYTGWLTFTISNAGDRAYDANDMIVVLPVEATVDFGDSAIGGCFNQGQDDDTRTMFCTGDRQIPAGGSRSYRFGLRVEIAPGPTARTLDGLALTVRANDRGAFPADRTPADNTARIDLELPPG
ncbi:hypothetical protein [Micromonospora musae]|uniref:Uncharacterized protein n=1 Tax=Micromonospora musae TaxID=1894970 RepID=A0A3A9Y4K4_9ACTN|nr:hypothetical protein [Micromonospora musae]RKN32278.1 hypothetical protein D7044_13525 [Micromonospora musae]